MRQENFLRHAGMGQGWGKTKSCVAGAKTPSFGPALPQCHPYFFFFFLFLSFFLLHKLTPTAFFFSSSFSFFFFLFFFIETSNILYPKKKHTWVPISQTQKIKPINTWFRSDTLTHKPTNMFIHTSTKIPLPPIIPIQRPQNKNSLSVKLSQQTMKLKSKTKI